MRDLCFRPTLQCVGKFEKKQALSKTMSRWTCANKESRNSCDHYTSSQSCPTGYNSQLWAVIECEGPENEIHVILRNCAMR